MFRSVFDADYQGYGIFLDKVLKPLFGDKMEVLPVAEDNPTNVSEEAMERARIKKIVRVANIAATFDRDTMEVFDITLEDNVNIARARVGIQQLIRRGLFVHTHAFMIFHAEHPEGENWRFSYARKLGTVGSMTDAKRYTYLFGKNMHCRTAIDRFAVLAAGEITDQKLLDAFNVEALSDEFFEEYRKKYAAFVKYITGKEFVKENGKWVEKAGTPNEELMAQFRGDDKAVRDYVKKMMGRITFLHFLQKKGWMNGDVNYMQHLFESSDQKANYLEAVLEPLFFGILNTKPQNRIKLFTERHWDLSLLDQWESFPYLNGGLFEEDEDDRLDVVFPENYFVGLFNFYSRFNFTVDENDPDDAEVGVDPEMLGKIFENLLEDNKDKGTFYTPKEIVRYMCQESLTAYLVGKTGLDEERIRAFVVHPYDEVENFTNQQQNQIYNALEGVKICDPAIGSGAFPMGLLNELVRCEEALLGEREEEHQSRAGLKKYIIQNNIYGVDIEKGAIDIARLRFWLSIVVDEDSPSPLPNLDYKIMQGNSLLESYKKVDLSHLLAEEGIGEEMQGGLFSDLDVIQDTREELAAYLEAYFNCSDHEEKLRIQQDIRTAINVQLSARNLNVDFGDLDIAANQEFFLWHTWFSDVFNRPSDCEKGFDIVIGNPPYISSATQMSRESLAKQRDDIVKSGRYSLLLQKWDIYVAFMELALRYLLSDKGIFSMIVPYPLTNQIYASRMRHYILDQCTLIELADLNGTKVFDNAMVSNCIPIIRKAESETPVIISHIKDNATIVKAFRLDKNVFSPDARSRIWQLENKKRLIDDYKGFITLGDICYISKGMVLYSEDGLFTNEDLVSVTRDEIHCRSYLEAKDIDSYIIKNVRFIEYDTERVPDKVSRPTFRELYNRPKLMFNCLGQLKVSIDLNNNHICQQGIRVAILWKDLKGVTNKSITSSIKRYSSLSRAEMEGLSNNYSYLFLLGLLNSSYVSKLYTDIRGGDYHVVPEHLRQIPIPNVEFSTQLKIGTLVETIIDERKKGHSIEAQQMELNTYVESLYTGV